jgi:ribosomal protein L30/L7E
MKFLLMILFLSACVNANKSSMSVPEADLKLSEEWMYADKMDGPKLNGEVITRPPGFEQLVMSLVIPKEGGLQKVQHCVYYQVPYKENRGHLRVQEMKEEGSCPDISTDSKSFVELDGIENLKVTMKNYKLSLEFDMAKNKKRIDITLPNIEVGLEHEKYRPIKEKRLVSGLRLLRLNDESFDFASNKYLGKISDRFSQGSAIRCQQVNKDCETVGENRCGECRYGWYEVVDFQCPQGGSKFCGQNHCGEKNEPACPRGMKVVDPEEAGICQSDLGPTPNLEKILVCQ